MRERIQLNESTLANFKALSDASNGNPFRLPPYNMRLNHGLVLPGEAVALLLSAKTDTPPTERPWLQHAWLATNPGGKLFLEPVWHRSSDGSQWESEIPIPTNCPGNTRVVWETPGGRLSRIFGVVKPKTPVLTLWVGWNSPEFDFELHQYDLPGDSWLCAHPFELSLEQTVAKLSPFVWSHWRYGDSLAPEINADYLLPGILNRNLLKIPEDIQRDGLRQVQRLWQLFGLGELELIASYTPGHKTFKILEELGILTLNSLCMWQNIIDGHSDNHWQINHTGLPSVPYHPAPDDFRRPGKGKGIVAFSMGSATSERMYSFGAFHGCPTNILEHQRHRGHSGIAENIDRFYAAVEGWIHDAANNDKPLCMTVGFENFVGMDGWRQANERAITYLVQLASEGRVIFANACAVSDFHRHHYNKQPETVQFQQDTYCGEAVEFKPHRLPDRIDLSNARFHALFSDGRTLPLLLWDYTQTWAQPEWDSAVQVRTGDEYPKVMPESIAADLNPFGCAPHQADLRGVHTETFITETPTGLDVTLRVQSPRALAYLPVSLWRLPLSTAKLAKPIVKLTWKKVVDGWSGNLHGVVTLESVPAGESEWTFSLTGKHRPPSRIDFDLGDGAKARTFNMLSGPRTCIWTETPGHSKALVVKVPKGSAGHVRQNQGTEIEPDANGRMLIPLEFSSNLWELHAPRLLGEAPIGTGGKAILGPVIERPVTPYARSWEVSDFFLADSELYGTTWSPAIAHSFKRKEFMSDFANIHGDIAKAGPGKVLWLRTHFHCTESMELVALLGYDGPLRLFIDGCQCLYDPHGGAPANRDSVRVKLFASPGRHEVLIALGTIGKAPKSALKNTMFITGEQAALEKSGSAAWGVYLRLERLDLAVETGAVGPLPSWATPMMCQSGIKRSDPDYKTADTTWFSNCRYGISFHWTAQSSPRSGELLPFRKAVENFRLAGFLDSIKESGADYVIFTATHALQTLPCPNEFTEQILAGRSCERDLIGEIADGLGKMGKHLIVYYNHSCNGGDDPEWEKAVGYHDRDKTRFVENLCDIVSSMGQRYGSRIKGWWFDSSYSLDPRGPVNSVSTDMTGFQFPWERWAKAAKAGFPERLITFNAGIAEPFLYTHHQDYWAGERGDLNDPPTSRYADNGLQWHGWTCLDDRNWVWNSRRPAEPPPFYSDAILSSFLKQCQAHHAPMTFNVAISQEGIVSGKAVSALKQAGERLRKRDL